MTDTTLPPVHTLVRETRYDSGIGRVIYRGPDYMTGEVIKVKWDIGGRIDEYSEHEPVSTYLQIV